MFEFGEVMRKDGLFCSDYYTELCKKYGYPKMTEKNSLDFNRISVIYEYRILLEKHFIEEFRKLSNKNMNAEEKRKVALQNSENHLDFYINLYWKEEYEKHKYTPNQLGMEVRTRKRENIRHLFALYLQYFGMDIGNYVAKMGERIANKFNTRPLAKMVFKDLNKVKTLSTEDTFKEIMRSYNELRKTKDYKSYEKKAKGFISKLCEFGYKEFENVIESQISAKRALYLIDMLDEDFAPDIIKEKITIEEDLRNIKEEDLITKNFIKKILKGTMEYMDDLFYLQCDLKTTDEEVIKRINTVIDNMTLLKKAVEHARKPYDAKYDRTAELIETNLKEAIHPMACYLHETEYLAS